MSLHKKLVLHVNEKRVLKTLQENRGKFIAVSDMSGQLNLSLNDTLDALNSLRMKSLASLLVGGWKAL